MREIDMVKWDRKAVYDCFSKYDHPVFSVAARLDVTELVQCTKERGSSFFTDLLYVTVKALNNIPQFRYRIVNDKVVQYDVVDPSFVVMTDNGSIITTRNSASDNYSRFYQDNREAIDKARKNGFGFNSEAYNDVFFISSMSWVDFVSMSNPYNFSDAVQTSIPRITWGKYTVENSRYKLTMDISVHHALLDGYHVALAFSSIQSYLDDIRNIIN